MCKFFKGVDAKVYPTYQCEGKCPFCLTEIRPKTKEVEITEFLANFAIEIDNYFARGGKKVLFTGGEPTQTIEKLLGMLKIIAPYNFELVVLYTNGSRLLETIEYQGGKKTILEFLKQHGLKHINMSVHHFSTDKRKALSEHIGSKDTEKIIREVIKSGLEIRLNCTLLKDYIGNVSQIKEYINWANSLGVTDIYFRDLFHINNRGEKTTPGNQKKLEYTDQQRIDFDKLIHSIAVDNEFVIDQELSRHRDWGRTHIFKHKPSNSQISFGTLNIGSEKNDEVTYFAINPNGKMTPNMNESEHTVKQ